MQDTKFEMDQLDPDEALDPQEQQLAGKRISTDFYRVAGGKNARMIAVPQRNGLMTVLIDWASLPSQEPCISELLPMFIKAWMAPGDDKNLTMREAVQALRDFEKAHEGLTSDFSRDDSDLTVNKAAQILEI